ncbi:MAG: hypothetical protein ACYC5M_14750 [Anaerolineae bacterium]
MCRKACRVFDDRFVLAYGEDARELMESIGRPDLRECIGLAFLLPRNPDFLGDGFREVWVSWRQVPYLDVQFERLDHFVD